MVINLVNATFSGYSVDTVVFEGTITLHLYSKITFNISSGSYGFHGQVIQPYLKFPY